MSWHKSDGESESKGLQSDQSSWMAKWSDDGVGKKRGGGLGVNAQSPTIRLKIPKNGYDALFCFLMIGVISIETKGGSG